MASLCASRRGNRPDRVSLQNKSIILSTDVRSDGDLSVLPNVILVSVSLI